MKDAVEKHKFTQLEDQQIVYKINELLKHKKPVRYQSVQTFAKAAKQTNKPFVGTKSIDEWFAIYISSLDSRNLIQPPTPTVHVHQNVPSFDQQRQMDADDLFIINHARLGEKLLSPEQFDQALPKSKFARFFPTSTLYKQYVELHKKNNPIRQPKHHKPSSTKTLAKLPYPFKSRMPPKLSPLMLEVEEDKSFVLEDSKRNLLKKEFSRKCYAPNRNSYEMDLMSIDDRRPPKMYLVIVNINTRFLIVYPIKNKSGEALKLIFEQFINEFKPVMLRGDGESAWFRGQLLQDLFKRKNIQTSFNPSKYIYHVKIIDSAIKTLRDIFKNNVHMMRDENLMQQAVEIMNNTINRNTKVTPVEMMMYPDLEYRWIRYCTQYNSKIKRKQQQKGLWNYQPNDILMICIEKEKTPHMFDKRRRTFEFLGKFIQYINGNVKVIIVDKYLKTVGKPIEIPIYFTKFVAHEHQPLPQNVLNVLNYDASKLEVLVEDADKDIETTVN
jgi:hypothetical protein